MKRLFDDDSMHLEKRLGTAKQAIDYCRKEESRVDGPWEYGEHKGQGKRTDIDDCVSAITDGASWKEIIEECPSTFVRYHKGLEKVKFIMTESPKWRDVEVFVYWGKPGTGKSRKVFENEEDVYRVQGGKWWCGYDGQDAIVFDDFEGGIDYNKMLNYLDGYKLMLETKGGQTYALWTKVYITSNLAPEDWYLRVDGSAALMRRIKEITYFGKNVAIGS